VAQVVWPEEVRSSGAKSSPWLGHGGRALLRAASARWSERGRDRGSEASWRGTRTATRPSKSMRGGGRALRRQGKADARRPCMPHAGHVPPLEHFLEQVAGDVSADFRLNLGLVLGRNRSWANLQSRSSFNALHFLPLDPVHLILGL